MAVTPMSLFFYEVTFVTDIKTITHITNFYYCIMTSYIVILVGPRDASQL